MFLLLICSINAFNQTPVRTYIIQKVMFDNNDKDFIDSSVNYINKSISVNLNDKKITLYQDYEKVFKIIRYGNPSVSKENGNTIFLFKCIDYTYEPCTIYLSYPDQNQQEPTLFVQYSNRDYMFYLKEF